MAQTPTRRRMLSTAALGPLAALLATRQASARPTQRILRDFDFTPYRLDAVPGDEDRVFRAQIDAELIEQCDRLLAARAEFLHLYCGKDAPDDPDNHPVIGPRLDALDAVEDELLPLLRGIRANSLASAEAMARVALIFAERDEHWQVPKEHRSWPAMAAAEWLAGDDFYDWAATHPQHRAQTPPPPVRRATT